MMSASEIVLFMTVQEKFDNLQNEKAEFEAKYQKLSQSYYTTVS
jgi:hypothetical protein